MAQPILLKRSSVAGKAPLTANLQYGELSINYTDGALYYLTSNNTVNSFLSNGSTLTANFGGNVVTTGNVFTGGNLIIGPTVSGLLGRVSNSTALLVNPSGVTPVAQPLFNPMVHIVGRDGVGTVLAIDCFGNGCGIINRHGRGTTASPTPAGPNDCMGGIVAVGYGTTGFSTANIDLMAGLRITSTELFTDTSMPTKLELRTVPVGSNTAVLAMTLNASGVISIHSTTDSTSTTTGALVVAGGAGIAGKLYIANTGDVSANIGAYQTYANTTISSTQANIGAYQTFANTTISTTQANIGAYQTYANTTNATTQANLGAYQTYANLTAVTQATSISTINANVGAYQTFANTTNATTQANLGAYQTFANTTISTTQANLGAYQTFANANVSNLYNSILGSNSAIVTANAAMKSYVDTSLSTLTNGASTALDTLLEIGTALGNNANFSGVVITWLGNITANNTAANATISSTQANIGAYQTYGNAQLALRAPIANPSFTGELTSAGNITVTGHVLPSANVTYSLGSPTRRWKDLYLSGNTMVLGQANIQSHDSGITIYAPQQTITLNQNLHTTATPSFANVTATGNLLVSGKLRDINGNAGLSGQYLVSTSTGVQWYTQASGSGALSGLSDVNLSSPQAQQVLTYNGTYWVNAAAGVTVASAVFASSQTDNGLVNDAIVSVAEDEGFVIEVSNNIYDLGVLSFTGIISLNNIDQSIKSDYLGYSIIFGF